MINKLINNSRCQLHSVNSREVKVLIRFNTGKEEVIGDKNRPGSYSFSSVYENYILTISIEDLRNIELPSEFKPSTIRLFIEEAYRKNKLKKE